MRVFSGRVAWAEWPEGIETDIRDLLRGCALAALDDILSLTGRDAPHVPPDLGKLLALFPPEREGDFRVRRNAKAVARAYSVTDPPEWTLLQRRWHAAARRAPLRFAALEVIARMLRRLRFDFHPGLPKMIDAIALEAWTSATFREEVALRLRDHLRTRVLLYPEPKLTGVLSIPFLWLAVLAHLKHRYSDARDRVTKALLSGMTNSAEAWMQEEGWAGFWELYLLGLAKRQAMPLPPVLNDWPLVSQAETDEIETPKGNSSIRNWRFEKPGFADRLLAGEI